MSKSKNNQYTPSQAPNNHRQQAANQTSDQTKDVIPDEVERRDGPGGN